MNKSPFKKALSKSEVSRRKPGGKYKSLNSPACLVIHSGSIPNEGRGLSWVVLVRNGAESLTDPRCLEQRAGQSRIPPKESNLIRSSGWNYCPKFFSVYYRRHFSNYSQNILHILKWVAAFGVFHLNLQMQLSVLGFFLHLNLHKYFGEKHLSGDA